MNIPVFVETVQRYQALGYRFDTQLAAMYYVMRTDQRGQGVACGNSWISSRKKCSKDKAKSTSKANLAKTKAKAKAAHALKRQAKRGMTRPEIEAETGKPKVDPKGAWKQSLEQKNSLKALASEVASQERREGVKKSREHTKKLEAEGLVPFDAYTLSAYESARDRAMQAIESARGKQYSEKGAERVNRLLARDKKQMESLASQIKRMENSPEPEGGVLSKKQMDKLFRPVQANK